MNRLIAVCTIVFAALTGTVARADYPDRTVKLIVPFAAGGPTDALARNLADGLRARLSRPVIIENKVGAGANIGAEFVANSRPDGYTLLFGTSGPLGINVNLFAKLGYDPVKSFDPVIMLGKIPNVLLANTKLPVNNLQELIAYARSGQKLTFASAGTGGSTHLAGELFKFRENIDLLHIPYRGAAPAMTDLIGGQVSLFFADVFVAREQIKAGTVKAIGVTTIERSSLLPDVPTFDEQGVKGFDSSVVFGVVAPKGTPPEIIGTLNAAFAAALKDQTVRAAVEAQGLIPAPSTTPEYLASFIASEIPRWQKVIQEIGIPKQ